MLDSVTELCQGNQVNQQEAMDEQIVKVVNFIIAYDATIETDMDQLTDTKVAGLTVLESMLEMNNAQSIQIAMSLRDTLNLEELYLAMNRFYYIDFYLKHRPRFAGDPEVHPQKHLKAGHQCYYVLARLTDLTGKSYEWETPKELKRIKSSAIDEEHYVARVEDLDEKLEHRFHEWVAKQTEGHSTILQNNKLQLQLFLEYSKKFLMELDRHNGPMLGPESDRFAWYREKTRSIEFLRDDELQKVYFEKPPVEISKTARKVLLLKMNLTTPQHKVRDFISEFEAIAKELKYQERLQHYVLTRLIAEGTGPYWKQAILSVTYALNVCMLAAYAAPTDPHSAELDLPAWFFNALYGLGGVHLFLALVVCGEFFANNHEFSANFVYHFFFLVFSVAGLFYNGYFYAFHMLHIVQENDILGRAIMAITKNGVSLLSVTALAVTAVYGFSVISFLFFRSDYDADNGQYCDSLVQCFATTLTWGLTHGGGLRETLGPGDHHHTPSDPHYIMRIVFDLLFWVLLSIIAMNLVLGIIVDTFSQLRSERERNMEELNNNCFICSLPGHNFENVGGFKPHIRKQHNMWDYICKSQAHLHEEHVR